MRRRRRGPASTVPELHSVEEGVRLLPSRPTERLGKSLRTLQQIRRRFGPLDAANRRSRATVRALTSLSRGAFQRQCVVPGLVARTSQHLAGPRYVGRGGACFMNRMKGVSDLKNTTGFVPSDHSYRPPDDIPMSWNAAGGMGAEHMPVLTSTPQEFWRYNQLRAPGDFSPYSSASTPRTPHFAPGAQNVAFAEQQRPSDSQPWPPHVPPPPRSVSYSHVENLRGTAFHTTPYHPDFRAPHVPSQHHLHHQQQHIPSPLDMSASLTSSTGPHSAPVGAQQHPPPYAQQHQTPYVLSPEQQQQQQQNPLHAPPPFPPHPNYPGTWYPHPSSFPPLEEDEPEQQPPPPLDYGAASRPRRSGP